MCVFGDSSRVDIESTERITEDVVLCRGMFSSQKSRCVMNDDGELERKWYNEDLSACTSEGRTKYRWLRHQLVDFNAEDT